MKRAIAALVLVACETAPVRRLEPVVTPTCGEAGPSRTPPPTVTPERILQGELEAGETAPFEGGQLVYHEDRYGDDSDTPTLELELSTDEVGLSPWPSERTLEPGRSIRLGQSRYHVEARASEGEPPERVRYRVFRRPCPASAHGPAPDRTHWLWVSTDGIAEHTFDARGQTLRVGVAGHLGGGLTFWFGYRDYGASFPPESGLSGGVDEWRFAVEAFERLPSARGMGRGHVRVRLDRAEPVHVLPAPIAASGCGEPSPSRTELPSALAIESEIHEVRVRPGARVPVGDTYVELVPDPTARLAAGDRRAPVHELRVGGRSPESHINMVYDEGWEVGRVGTWLFTARREEGAPHASVRLTTLPCPEELRVPRIDGPRYLWLSTYGTERVLVDSGRERPLELEVDTHGAPSFSIHGDGVEVDAQIGSTLVGRSYLAGGYEIVVVDVIAGAGTRRAGADPRGGMHLNVPSGWAFDGIAPALHVQLRVAPAE